MQKSGTIYNL